MNPVRNIVGALALTGLAAFSQPAFAQTQFNGAQPATYTGSNFTLSGNTITASQTGAAGSLTVNGVTSDLLGINGLWIVDASGNTISGVTAKTGGPVGGTAWTPESNPAGFGGQPGYSPNKNWITLAPLSDFPSATGNTPSDYTSGVFNFTGLSGLSSYDLGIDYLQKNGNTGRAYFSVTPTPPAAVPEPASLALLGLGALPLGLIARRRLAGGSKA